MVSMVSFPDENLVGNPGAVGVSEGVLPDGSVYEWTKKDRVGAAFKDK